MICFDPAQNTVFTLNTRTSHLLTKLSKKGEGLIMDERKTDDLDHTQLSAASDLGLPYLLRPICPNT